MAGLQGMMMDFMIVKFLVLVGVAFLYGFIRGGRK
jgi:hypothetical protein